MAADTLVARITRRLVAAASCILMPSAARRRSCTTPPPSPVAEERLDATRYAHDRQGDRETGHRTLRSFASLPAPLCRTLLAKRAEREDARQAAKAETAVAVLGRILLRPAGTQRAVAGGWRSTRSRENLTRSPPGTPEYGHLPLRRQGRSSPLGRRQPPGTRPHLRRMRSPRVRSSGEPPPVTNTDLHA